MKTRKIGFGIINNLELLSKNKEWINYIYLSDNNSKLWGKTYYGLKVISPNQLLLVDYDEIVILTWAFYPIKKQLIQMGVYEDKIKSINKRLVTKSVFQDANVREESLKFLSELCLFFNKYNVNIFIEAGTLLGLIRDNDLISWDTDLDLSVSDVDIIKALSLLNNFRSSSVYNIEIGVDEVSLSHQIVGYVFILNQRIPFDIFSRKIHADYSVSDSGEFFKVKKKHFDIKCDFLINKYKFNIPYHHEEYLATLYGHNWLIPKKNFTYSDFSYSLSKW